MIMKRIASLALSLVLLLGCLPAAMAAEDGPSSWAEEEVSRAVEVGLVPQSLQGDWQQPMTRGEFAMMVIRYLAVTYGRTDEQLVNQTVKHLVEDLHFVTPDEVIGGFTLRATKAYPVYGMGYEEPLGKMKDYINSIENLQFIGRGGSFRYNNTDHSIETGLLAAKNILGGNYDLDGVNADQEYHEMKKVTSAQVG